MTADTDAPVVVVTPDSHLFATATEDGRPEFSDGDLDALIDDLIEVLGPRGVSQLPRALERASRDGSGMSPVLSRQVSDGELGTPDLVCFPRSVEEVPHIVAAAVRHGVPVTTRGKGTGNYGQVLPRFGGLVLDMTSLTDIHGLGMLPDGSRTITADAGARMLALEQYAWERDQQLWMYPSTVQSTIGGFLAGGSAGTGTIVHGRNHQGFVTAVDVVMATDDCLELGDGGIIHLEGEDAQPYIHTYGVAGIIVRATIRVEPLQEWQCVYASFPDHHSAFAAAKAVMTSGLQPRLMSADSAEIVDALPDDPALVPGRASLRGIIDESDLESFGSIVSRHRGRLEAVRHGINQSVKLSTISYNHPTWWLQKKYPGQWFHMECQGDAVVDRLAEVEAVYPGGLFHLEIGNGMMFGMLNGRVPESGDPAETRAVIASGVPKLAELGVGVHSPHQWYIDLDVERIRALSESADPHGLLNPGRWM